MKRIIGVDLDNTIINYDRAFHRNACELELITHDAPISKKSIRDRIWDRADGDIKWQQLQAMVYGPKIGQAELMPGVRRFLSLCRKYAVEVFIVSHKTRYATGQNGRTDLREAALNWLWDRGLFTDQELGLSEKRIFFEPERKLKVARLQALKCTHFIDDLEETFFEQSFPEDVEKMLFVPTNGQPKIPNVRVFKHWDELSHFFFHAGN